MHIQLDPRRIYGQLDLRATRLATRCTYHELPLLKEADPPTLRVYPTTRPHIPHNEPGATRKYALMLPNVALPVEIWAYIFFFAGANDGPTGRALALTCRWVKEVSSFYQLQQLSATRLSQFAPLAAMLERRLAPALRPVVRLELKACVGSPALPSHGATQADPSAYDATALVMRILTAVAPTLRVLDLDVSDACVPLPRALVPTRLPVLEELDLRGARALSFPEGTPPPETLLPTLQRLRVRAVDSADVAVLEDIMTLPAVRDVYISGHGVLLPVARAVLVDVFSDARSETWSLRRARVVIDLHAPPETVHNSARVLAEHDGAVKALREVVTLVDAWNLRIVTS
ncbi:hypothetical protein BV25DRAFT_1165159 [Artomyces pyxidatus]|uniref:Uncharacterized protein n=1 Tax=Artomyces pyxidatus TaxID=48021 RepID=A0ACB8SS59_9AGAM|nr:hypothetical protein BV25DRAFT_1165159 [Artomyces pyxidatus]